MTDDQLTQPWMTAVQTFRDAAAALDDPHPETRRVALATIRQAVQTAPLDDPAVSDYAAHVGPWSTYRPLGKQPR